MAPFPFRLPDSGGSFSLVFAVVIWLSTILWGSLIPGSPWSFSLPDSSSEPPAICQSQFRFFSMGTGSCDGSPLGKPRLCLFTCPSLRSQKQWLCVNLSFSLILGPVPPSVFSLVWWIQKDLFFTLFSFLSVVKFEWWLSWSLHVELEAGCVCFVWVCCESLFLYWPDLMSSLVQPSPAFIFLQSQDQFFSLSFVLTRCCVHVHVHCLSCRFLFLCVCTWNLITGIPLCCTLFILSSLDIC